MRFALPSKWYTAFINRSHKTIVSRESLVFLFGLIVFLTPLLGVPPAWKDYLMIIIGALLIVIGFSLRRSSYYQKIDKGNGEIGTDSFVESQPSLLDQEAESN